MRARCPDCGGPLRFGFCRLCGLDLVSSHDMGEMLTMREHPSAWAVARNQRWATDNLVRFAARTTARMDPAIANDTANSPATSTWLPGAATGYCRTAAERTSVVGSFYAQILERNATWENLGKQREPVMRP